MAEVVQAVRAKDGKLFDSMAEAERHEAVVELRKMMAEQGVGRGGEWDAGMFHDFIVENAARLAPLLAKLAPAPG